MTIQTNGENLGSKPIDEYKGFSEIALCITLPPVFVPAVPLVEMTIH